MVEIDASAGVRLTRTGDVPGGSADWPPPDPPQEPSSAMPRSPATLRPRSECQALPACFDFLALLLTSNNAKTTPPFLGSFVDGRGQFLAVLSAAATVAALPVIAAGWTAQKQLVRGLSLGAVK